MRPDLRWQGSVQNTAGDYKNFLTAHWIPEAVAGIVEGRELCCFSVDGDAGRQHLSPDAVGRRSPEHHGQHEIRGGSRDEEHPEADIRIEDAVHRRNASAGNKSQGQHTARKAAGNRKKQNCQSDEPFLSTKSYQSQQNACRSLNSRFGEKACAWQKAGHCVAPTKESCQKIPSPPQGHTGQAGGSEEQQIIHQRIEKKYAVRIDHCHHAAPFPLDSIKRRDCKIGRKRKIASAKAEAIRIFRA